MWCPFSIGDAQLQLSFTLFIVQGVRFHEGDPLPKPYVEDIELVCEYCDEDCEDVCMLWDSERGAWAPHKL